MAQKRIAIIGAGPCGLTTIKCVLEENLEPVCFEKTEYVGGLWRYHDEDIEDLASVMKTTIINSSKEITALSDFPPPADAPNYMHNKCVYDYLKSYAKAFDLEKHIQFNKQVVEVDKAENYVDTGRLTVCVRDTKTGEVSKRDYDGVMVCVGHHIYPNIPFFPGMEEFKGKILHTHSLKNVENFHDKTVVVIGVGNSGMDAAVDISAVASKVHLSTRRGAWVLPRVGPEGMPFDIVMLRRWISILVKMLPFSLFCWICEAILNYNFDHDVYNLKPKHRVWSQHPTVSDALPIKLLSGTVVIKGDVQEFTESGVLFKNEDSVTECDSVVLATGYRIKFPFLHNIATIIENDVNLYKYVFLPHMVHPTLAILGLVQIVGGGFPVGEIQGRWATLVMNGKLSLPERKIMDADIQKRKEINSKRYVHTERHTIQADYIEYIDEIASMIGAKPSLPKLFLSDFKLFWTLLFGPSLPYQYRLQGPHAWAGARKALLEWRQRVVMPLNKNYQSQTSSRFNIVKLTLEMCLIMLLIGVLVKILC